LSYFYRLTNEAIALFWRAAPDYEAHLTLEGCLILSGEPIADGNIAAIWGGPAPEERLREFGERIVERELPCLMYMCPEESLRLAPVARSYGFSNVGVMPLMVLAPDADLSIQGEYSTEIVASVAGRDEWVTLYARAFGIPIDVVNHGWSTPIIEGPGLTIFLARRNGEATSTVTTIRAGATVGVYALGTPPVHRRRGAASAVLAHAINHHRRGGARLFYVHATEIGQPLYRKLGFETIVELSIWVRGHSTQMPG
jgi:GNAT superfamily N-acetyltransferase